MEDAAIKKGFADLRPGREYDGLHQSALCRARADWLVGINATRLFSVLYHRTLNVGRVMTPYAGAHRPAGGGDRGVPPGSLLRSKPSLRRFCRRVRKVQRKSGGGRPRRRLRRSAGHGQGGAAHGENGESAAALRPDRAPAGGQPHASAIPHSRRLTTCKPSTRKKLCTYPRTDSRFLTDDLEASVPELVTVAAAICETDRAGGV